jgi:N-acetylmuramoyl-L-alanine amidase.
MKLAGVPFYQANGNNYTPGRGRPVRKLTIHHSAGWENTLRYLWADPNRNGSSHFWVGNQPNQIEQYVDTDDTAWCNGNWASNQESISVETRGDWRGYYDRATLDNLYTLMVKLLPHYPNLILEFHMDVSSTVTLCPADLKHKGYARAEFDRAVASFNTPKPPTPHHLLLVIRLLLQSVLSLLVLLIYGTLTLLNGLKLKLLNHIKPVKL